MPDLPDWQPLDGAAPAAPSAGRVVAVVATESAVSEGWGAGAAVRLARQWADQGARVALVDAAVGDPSLHDAAGIPNREGLADAALFGASIERVSHTPEGERFLLVTAGTPLADPGSVARDPRWYRIIGGMAEASVTLMLYLHAGAGSAAAFLGSASDIVVLAGPDDASPSVLRDLEPLVRAVTGPGEGGMPVGVSSVSDDEPAVAAAPGGGRMGKMVLFVILAVVVAAALGLFLSSGIG
jgi:hypothetical protein